MNVATVLETPVTFAFQLLRCTFGRSRAGSVEAQGDTYLEHVMFAGTFTSQNARCGWRINAILQAFPPHEE